MEHESTPFGRGMSRIDSTHDEVEHWLMIRLSAPLPEPPGRSQRGPRLDAADMMMRSPPADAIDLTPAEQEPQDRTAWSDTAFETLATMLSTRKPPSPLASLMALFRRGGKGKRD